MGWKSSRVGWGSSRVGWGSSKVGNGPQTWRRDDMATDEALELARRAIFQAARRDAYSGGSVTVYHVGPRGWRRVSSHDVAGLHDGYGG